MSNGKKISFLFFILWPLFSFSVVLFITSFLFSLPHLIYEEMRKYSIIFDFANDRFCISLYMRKIFFSLLVLFHLFITSFLFHYLFPLFITSYLISLPHTSFHYLFPLFITSFLFSLPLSSFHYLFPLSLPLSSFHYLFPLFITSFLSCFTVPYSSFLSICICIRYLKVLSSGNWGGSKLVSIEPQWKSVLPASVVYHAPRDTITRGA